MSIFNATKSTIYRFLATTTTSTTLQPAAANIMHPLGSRSALESPSSRDSNVSLSTTHLNPLLNPNVYAWLYPFNKSLDPQESPFNKAKGIVNLSKSVFAIPQPRNDILFRCLKYEQSWLAAGTASTKTLGQVRGTSAKAFPQKGRGKARVGSIRAPQIRGGYTVHGPRPADKTTDIPRKVYNLGIRNAISLKFHSNRLVVVDSVAFKKQQQQQDGLLDFGKEALRSYLASLNIDGKKTYLMYGASEPDYNLVSAADTFTNYPSSPRLPNGEKEIIITPASHVSVSTLMDYEYLVVDLEAVKVLEKMYHVA